MRVSFAALDGRWVLRFTGHVPRPGEEYDVPKRGGKVCHKTVGQIVRVEDGVVYTEYKPDCGRRPRVRTG